MFCWKCGKENDDGEIICGQCGALIKQPGNLAEETPPPVVPEREPERIQPETEWEREHARKRAVWHQCCTIIFIGVTLICGMAGCCGVYITGFGIGNYAEHYHLFNIGYLKAAIYAAYFASLLAIINAGLFYY